MTLYPPPLPKSNCKNITLDGRVKATRQDTSTGQGRCPIAAGEYSSIAYPTRVEEAELISIEKFLVAKIFKIFMHRLTLVLVDSIDCD